MLDACAVSPYCRFVKLSAKGLFETFILPSRSASSELFGQFSQIEKIGISTRRSRSGGFSHAFSWLEVLWTKRKNVVRLPERSSLLYFYFVPFVLVQHPLACQCHWSFGASISKTRRPGGS